MKTRSSRRLPALAALLIAIALVGGGGGKSAAQAPPATVAVVTEPDGLNLRGGPGTQYPTLQRLPRGAVLTVLGPRVAVNWLPVSYGDTRGFVHDAYILIRAADTGTAPAATPARPAAPPSGPGPLTDNGLTLLGVFASDSDGTITVADEFVLVASIRPPAGVNRVTVRASGAPFLTAARTVDVQPGENWVWLPNFRVDTEWEPVLREEVIRTVGGSIPIRDGALVLAFDFTDAEGRSRTATFQPAVHEAANASRIARVEYPNLTAASGLPPRGGGAESYYLRGNTDFHHPHDFYVRKLAIEAGRLGGVWPDSPARVADNIFTYINRLLGDGDPGGFNNDVNFARLIDQGTIKRGQLNGAYICIGQSYLMTSLTRTVGIPSRELNIAVGRPAWRGNDGVWRVEWWQEGAVQTWYNGAWQHYDLWLGFKGFDGYFRENLAYQVWAAYNRQTSLFREVSGVSTGLRGHDFNAFPGEPPQWEFIGEAVKPGSRVVGMPDGSGAVSSARRDVEAYLSAASDGPVSGQHAPAVDIARPPAKRILYPPEQP